MSFSDSSMSVRPRNAAASQPFTTKALAQHYSVSTRTIATWRAEGKIPFLRITARCFRYDLDQVERALAKSR